MVLSCETSDSEAPPLANCNMLFAVTANNRFEVLHTPTSGAVTESRWRAVGVEMTPWRTTIGKGKEIKFDSI